jgi:hypothetical protein
LPVFRSATISLAYSVVYLVSSLHLTAKHVHLQPNAPDKEGLTPIEVAKEGGYEDIVKVLAAFGAKARFKGAIRSVMKMKGGVDKWKLAAVAANVDPFDKWKVAQSSAVTAKPLAAPAKPAAEPAGEPAGEPAAEPAAEPSAEPAAEPAAEPSKASRVAGDELDRIFAAAKAVWTQFHSTSPMVRS